MLNSFRYTIKQAFGQVLRNKTMSIASVFSITAMLLILGIFFILVININMVTESVKADYDTIEVFMQEDASKEDAQAIIDGMTGFDGVESATYRTKKEALAILKDRWGDQGYLLDNLAKNPLPDSVVIKISSLEKAQAIADKRLLLLNGVDELALLFVALNDLVHGDNGGDQRSDCSQKAGRLNDGVRVDVHFPVLLLSLRPFVPADGPAVCLVGLRDLVSPGHGVAQLRKAYRQNPDGTRLHFHKRLQLCDDLQMAAHAVASVQPYTPGSHTLASAVDVQCFPLWLTLSPFA